MLHPAPHRGHLTAEALVRLSQLVFAGGLQRHVPEGARLARRPLQAVDDVALALEHRPVVFAQQVWQLADVSLIDCRDRHGIGQAAIYICAD